ncbi:hypothetical protein EI545_04640 [Tabrizicola piscis]|uniref:Uncharacterized protein n=1 Tax=Tabrizicola piscis TaxID=2494374 RepID=A0A3S8U3J9_9RHOB|nr:ATP synthase subunit I [Tabrizicola piscis]AZL58187.1 hypothetical protein EI545_04640 [Tabrizicola piscis]
MKQAIVILHGMGEQVPMTTLNSFVRSVWTTDDTLVDPGKPDPNTGGSRDRNVSWAKPDARNSSTELRRITTERDRAGNYTDFYEYYWAHLMQGTTWEHVSTWIKDLLLRDPRTRVPKRVFHAWVVLWIVALAVVGLTAWGLWPKAEAPKPWLAWLSALLGMATSAFVSAVLIKRFGDVARYVKALPPNVAKRHAIRQAGVDLLARLIDTKEYDRIVVVAHSLGTIVAYDILAQLYSYYNTHGGNGPQPERHRLEQMVRDALAGGKLDIDAYQDQQARAFAEAREQGAPWIVSDFITLGAPLAHAEFLIAESHDDLRERQRDRLLPTCPPVLEYDGTTKLLHFTYSTARDRALEDCRTPHHAALFGFTRWTNLYSHEKGILTGDLISGPVGDAFGLDGKGCVVSGIRDIAVLPAMTDGKVSEGHRRSFFSHNNYWALDKGTETTTPRVPHHIAELRRALRLLK